MSPEGFSLTTSIAFYVHYFYYIGVAGSSPLNYSFIGKRSQNAQTVKKVPSSRHGARPQGQVHGSALHFVPRDCEAEARPADETTEAQRKRGAACGRNSRAGVGAAVQIYERATTRDGNLANSNKRGSGLPFASPLRRAQQKQGTATTRGKEFLSRVCGQKWVPPGACRFLTRYIIFCPVFPGRAGGWSGIPGGRRRGRS